MLEKKRRSNLEIEILSDIESPHIKIAPLLFLPLVENAVKYSQKSNGENSYIRLNMREKSGKYVRKRLELIYPEKHTLVFQDDENDFKAHLNLELS